MSRKLQLPDEILDAVSGGAFTFQGHPVDSFSMTDEGMSVSVAGKSIFVEWDAKEKAAIAADPAGFSALKKLTAETQASSGKYDLEKFLAPYM